MDINVLYLCIGCVKFYQIKFNRLRCKFEEHDINKVVLKIEKTKETFIGYVKLLGGKGVVGFVTSRCSKIQGEGYKLYYYVTVSKKLIDDIITSTFVLFLICTLFLVWCNQSIDTALLNQHKRGTIKESHQ